jgi:hypothetical protein
MQRFFGKIVDNRNPGSLSAGFRRQRLKLFLEMTAALPRPVTILDVGGEQRFWEVMGLAGNPEYHITLLNTTPQPVTFANLRGLNGDATDLSRFSAEQFALAFSNSVIEHLGSFERQQRMAREVQRVGRSYFVQTPNRSFPIEPHFLLPFFQYYPERLKISLVQHFALGWYPRIPAWEAAREHIHSHRLLDHAELHQLFPGANIYQEKVLGLVKSLVAYQD